MTRLSSHRTLLLACVVAVSASACSGPSTRIDATLREFPQKVRLKAAEVDAPAIVSVPPTATQITGGLAPLTGPAPTLRPTPRDAAVTTTTSAPTVPCPKAGPGETALLAAGPAVTKPPQPATYPYRTSGKHTVGGAQASAVEYPTTGTRTTGAPVVEPGVAGGVQSFAYDVLVTLGESRTLTRYRVVPAGSAGPRSVAPGLYIVAMRTLDPSGRELSRFLPTPEMLLLPFPADQGVTFNVASTDPTSGTTMTYAGTVGDHVRVDACGKVVDTRAVTITGTVSGRSCGTSACTSQAGSGSTSTADFIATYAIGTQYGGLSLQDEVTVTGGGLGTPFTDVLRGTINVVPAGGSS